MAYAKWKKFSKEQIQEMAQNSTSYSEMARKLGYEGTGSGNAIVKQVLLNYQIDTSHFKGHAWNKFSSENSQSIKKQFLASHPYKCEICGISDWNNKPITLELHHKDGNHYNNNESNLMMLCPNCHSQTNNFRGKNNRIYSDITDEIFLQALLNEKTINAACVSVGIPANQNNYIRTKKLLNENKKAKQSTICRVG